MLSSLRCIRHFNVDHFYCDLFVFVFLLIDALIIHGRHADFIVTDHVSEWVLFLRNGIGQDLIDYGLSLAVKALEAACADFI